MAFSDWAKAKREIFAACDLSGFLKAHYSLLGSAAPPRGVEQSPVMAACWVAADLGESSSFLYPFFVLIPSASSSDLFTAISQSLFVLLFQ